MSALKEEGVIVVKNAACKRLLEKRVEIMMKSKKISSCLNRIHVAMPKLGDGKERPPCIPQAFLDARACATKEARKLEKDIENENGVVGVYSTRLKKRHILENEEWKEYDIIEIMDGRNVDAMDIDQPNKKKHMLSRSRSRSRPPSEVVPGDGFKDSAHKLKAIKLGKKASKKRNKDSRKGEVDRVIVNLKPKHLSSGMRSIGKTYRC